MLCIIETDELSNLVLFVDLSRKLSVRPAILENIRSADKVVNSALSEGRQVLFG